MMTRTEAFAAVPLFSGLDPERIEELARLATPLHYDAGDTVFTTGEAGTSVYVVLDGEIEVSIEGPRGEPLVLALATAGQCVGELSLLDGQQRSATVVATRESELLALRRNDFLAAIADRDAVTAVLASLAARIRRTNQKLAELAVLDPPARFARALIELAELDGVSVTDETKTGKVRQATRIDRDVTVSDLAAMTALHKNTIEKLLMDYQLDDVIRKEGDRLTIIRMEVLERAS
jgi:CRP-like cAMP-binding protein